MIFFRNANVHYFEQWSSNIHILNISSCFLLKSTSSMGASWVFTFPYCSLGFLDNPKGMLSVLESTLFQGDHRAILFTSSYPPLEAAIFDIQSQGTKNTVAMHTDLSKGIYLFSQRLLCVSWWAHTPPSELYLWVVYTVRIFIMFYSLMVNFIALCHISGCFQDALWLSIMGEGKLYIFVAK